MPDFCHPNLIVSDLMLSKADTSHPACKGFKVDSFKSVWIASKYFPLSSSDWTCRTYQFENSFFMCFLNSSFPDKSSGCNSEVHPAGTYRIRMLFFVISSLKSDTWLALKTSKIHKAGVHGHALRMAQWHCLYSRTCFRYLISDSNMLKAIR